MREGRKDNIVFDEVHIHSKFFMFFVDNMQKILSYKSMAYRAQLVLMIFFCAGVLCCIHYHWRTFLDA